MLSEACVCFLFLLWHYSPRWTLASLIILHHPCWSGAFILQFLTPVLHKPSSTSSSHNFLGTPRFLALWKFSFIIFFGSLSSFIFWTKICPIASHCPICNLSLFLIFIIYVHSRVAEFLLPSETWSSIQITWPSFQFSIEILRYFLYFHLQVVLFLFLHFL